MTFASNSVTQACSVFQFFRYYGLRPAEVTPSGTRPADAFVYFEDNLFDGNRFEAYADCRDTAARIPLFDDMGYFRTNFDEDPHERIPDAADFALGNNVFRDNDFGRSYPVEFGDRCASVPVPVVPGRVIDGGGNRCRQPDTADYPLRCH